MSETRNLTRCRKLTLTTSMASAEAPQLTAGLWVVGQPDLLMPEQELHHGQPCSKMFMESLATIMLIAIVVSMNLYLCRHCNTEKPIEDFYPYAKRKCKKCFTAYRLKWVKDNPEMEKAARVRFWKNNRDRILKKHRAKPRKSYRSPGYVEQLRAYRNAHRLEWNVKARVRHAVLTGKLKRPNECSHCGYKCKPQAHHEDYDKPFDVRWLCASCHRRLHKGTLIFTA